jgi:hypothetical protein
MPHPSRSRGANRLVHAAIALSVLLLAASSASATLTISYCQGPFGRFETFTICAQVCCPGDLVPTTVCATTASVNCGDPFAVMAAVDAAVATLEYPVGTPIFGAPAVVPTPVGGQVRHEYPLGAAFAAADCCVIGGNVTFFCGTMSAAWACPCSKPGGPPPGPGPFKLGIFGPPPAFPTTLTVWFIGCAPISVMLTGTETAADVKSLLLAALLGAGYTAFINASCEVEVLTACAGPPLGVEEFGLGGGAPMALGLGACPPFMPPVGVRPSSWGAIKAHFDD